MSAHAMVASKRSQLLLPLRLGCFSRLLVMSCVLLLDLIFDDYDTSAAVNSSCLSPSSPHDRLQSQGNHSHQYLFDNLFFPERFLKQARDHEDVASGSLEGKREGRRTTEEGETAVARGLESLVVWDGVFMLRIAECGYEYEQFYAFFPLFPLTVRFLAATALRPFLPFLGFRATLALAGLVLSNISFVLSAILLHRLSIAILGDEDAACRATALYCFNPASIFYSSIYSESLFALLSFAGLVCLVDGWPWPLAAALFGLSSLTRSNGILHCGFFLFLALQRASRHLTRENRLHRAACAVVLAIVQSAVVLAPFVAFQWYGYTQFCSSFASGREGEGGVSQSLRPWCSGRLPYVYGFVQSHYWDVGFLRYFQVKQIPNFLLALPILSLATAAIARFARAHPRLFFSLGLAATDAEHLALTWQRNRRNAGGGSPADSAEALAHVAQSADPGTATTPETTRSGLRLRPARKASATSAPQRQVATSQSPSGDEVEEEIECEYDDFSNPAALCFIYQLGFMAAVAFFVMHVQVATRFLSVCPPLYWYAAQLTKSIVVSSHGGRSTSQPCLSSLSFSIWAWFLTYTFAGTLLFTNFYPFT